jgi:hypothetical protein
MTNNNLGNANEMRRRHRIARAHEINGRPDTEAKRDMRERSSVANVVVETEDQWECEGMRETHGIRGKNKNRRAGHASALFSIID